MLSGGRGQAPVRPSHRKPVVDPDVESQRLLEAAARFRLVSGPDSNVAETLEAGGLAEQVADAVVKPKGVVVTGTGEGVAVRSKVTTATNPSAGYEGGCSRPSSRRRREPRRSVLLPAPGLWR